MSRPTRAFVSVAAMRHNLSIARRCATSARARTGEPGVGAPEVWAVVKANAYGHGLANALRAFGEADGLALVEFDAALRLRELGWRGQIVMLEGAFEPEDVALAARHGLTLVVHDEGQLPWIERFGADAAPAVVLKFDSGMRRLGFDAAGLRRAHARLARSARAPGLMTHFASADVPGGAIDAAAAFAAATTGLAGPRSLANSAALLDPATPPGDVVRPGIMLYGASPFADRAAAALGLRAAMTLESRLIGTRMLRAGDGVGYGATFRAPTAMRIGIVACGYADGYPRHAPSGTPVLVEGVRTGTVGRVSMDMLAVDLAPVPNAQVGAPVELWGEALSVDEVAAAAGTIGYELLCALAQRVPLQVRD